MTYGHQSIVTCILKGNAQWFDKKTNVSQGSSCAALAVVSTASLRRLCGYLPSCEEMAFGFEELCRLNSGGRLA